VTRYAIGLGSNLGDRRQHLLAAGRDLADRADGWQVSGLYETEPVGGPDQGAFLNAVMAIETDLEPSALLDLCQQLEERHGRERSVHWGPRTLDLDIITSDGDPVDDTNLVIPHPRAAERAFVLVPLGEVWPEAPLGAGLTAVEALERMSGDGVRLVTKDWLK
jgi:2-amino-4-hydroxy-6-hydroxymethyldihydropteridine diphosphokinase